MKTRHHDHDDHHDDFGGLQRDLGATGAAIDRRGMLRLAARFGVGAGALTLIGCGSSSGLPGRLLGQQRHRRFLQQPDS